MSASSPKTLVLTLVLALALVLLAATAALAVPAEGIPGSVGQDFGEHISTHVQMDAPHFGSGHNPGQVHKGVTGWADMHVGMTQTP